MSDKILKIVGRYIYDSRGNPTVEVDLWTSKGMVQFPFVITIDFLHIIERLSLTGGIV